MGYDKLSRLDAIVGGNLIVQSDKALDIGSSAGGFLEYLLEKGAVVKGVEVSERFKDALLQLASANSNLSIVMEDAFKIDPFSLFGESELDLLLVDVTTDPQGTAFLIERFSPLLRRGGRLIAAFKSKTMPSTVSLLKDRVSNLGYADVCTVVLDDSRQEFHVTAIRN
jgi:predicted rRNA methylase YqxC with S4 and FtsJ domains